MSTLDAMEHCLRGFVASSLAFFLGSRTTCIHSPSNRHVAGARLRWYVRVSYTVGDRRIGRRDGSARMALFSLRTAGDGNDRGGGCGQQPRRDRRGDAPEPGQEPVFDRPRTVCVVAVSMEKVEVRGSQQSDHAAVASIAHRAGHDGEGDGGESVPHVDGDDALTALTLDHHFGY
ncbi:hypothetical protein THAOC_13970, partial [Thalassiosira oceanica]